MSDKQTKTTTKTIASSIIAAAARCHNSELGERGASITVAGVGQRLSPRYKMKRTFINSINNYCLDTGRGSGQWTSMVSVSGCMYRYRSWLWPAAKCVCGWVCSPAYLDLQLMFLFSVMLHCKPKSKAHRAYAHLLNENRSMALPSWPGQARRHGTADSSNLQLNANCIVVELLYNWCNVHRARARAGAGAGARVRARAVASLGHARGATVCLCQ